MRRRFSLLVALLWLGLVPILLIVQGVARAEAAPLPQPTNLKCAGLAATTVVVIWSDTATDETDYRVERSVDGGAWVEIATLAADKGSYKDEGLTIPGSAYRYRVRSYRAGDDTFSPYSATCNNRRIYETPSFRVFYGLLGTDDGCATVEGNGDPQQVCLTNTSENGLNVFVKRAADALEGSVAAFSRLDFQESAASPPSGVDKSPLNITWCDGGGCQGFGVHLGLSPMLMEFPFDTATHTGDPGSWMVTLHELFHNLQAQYPGLDDPASKWVIEGQARSIQDKICIGGDRDTALCLDDTSTGYASYVDEVNEYMGNPGQSLTEASYNAVLFWTYLVEQYGKEYQSDDAEQGMDFLLTFWEEVAAHAAEHPDGITAVDLALAALDHPTTFREVWKDFAVANYAKDLTGPNVPDEYQYTDMTQPGGNAGEYAAVKFSVDEPLALDEVFLDTNETVLAWGARYYRFTPAANVPVVELAVTQDSSVPLYYTVLAVRDGDIVEEHNAESRHFTRTIANDGTLDEVVLIVAGLENPANFRLAANGTQPTLRILRPLTNNPALVGDPTAPDKFLVAVEVVDGQGVPLEGVQLDDFAFQVGAQAMAPDNVLTSATVMGQQWFVLRAPTQAAPSDFDLQVSYNAMLTDTEALAVRYQPRADADSMLVIDRSGSMADDGKLAAAVAAARLFVDSWREGDALGLLSFNETPSNPPDMALTPWTDSPGGGSRQTALNALAALVANGGTAIGPALQAAWDAVAAAGDSDHDWALVLLSDGLENEGVSPAFQEVVDALAAETDKKPVVHTVAVGPDADRPGMQRAASRTGGTYQYVSLPAGGALMAGSLQLELDARYRMIATDIVGLQQSYSFTGPANDGNPNQDLLTIPLEGSVAELRLSLSWVASAGCCTIELRTPGSALVAPVGSDTRHRVWRVPNPQSGNWTLRVARLTPSAPEPSYYAQLAVRSDVTMDAFLTTPLAERQPGVPMPILVALTDAGPITGASVVATITRPSGGVSTLTLHDDGAHGDGAATDGLYGATFASTGQPGSYSVKVRAQGTSPLSGAFTRERLLAFHLAGDGDRDDDGLPDLWEIRYGTDPDRPDADADPDGDGSPNRREWEAGTDPLDPDTDDGGESDGTDREPLEPRDDRVRPTRATAHPNVGRVDIPFVAGRGPVRALLLRSAAGGPFTLVQSQSAPLTGLFTDTRVVNGQSYCYHIILEGAEGSRSAPSAPTCATPRVDPLPPHGGVSVNGGASTTLHPTVTLRLWASDAVDPESEYPGAPDWMPPQSSATTVTHMRLSHEPDFVGATWEPYAPTKPWTFAQPSGYARVYVQYRDAAGNVSDTSVGSIRIQPEVGGVRIYLPLVSR